MRVGKRITLTAFYTPARGIVKAVAMKNMRLSDRLNVLEPSCGVGNFMVLFSNAVDATEERQLSDRKHVGKWVLLTHE